MALYYSGKPDYFEQISKDNVVGKKFIYKFGRNPIVGATEVLIASGGVYGLPTTAETITVTSDDENDVPGGSGARSVHVFGLDINYDEIEEIVLLDDASTQEFLRVFRAYVETSGTITPIGGANIGLITIEHSISALDMILISPNEGQTLTACFTIPRGFEGFTWSADVTTGQGKDAKASLKSRKFLTDAPFIVKGVRDSFQNTVKQDFKIPTLIPEKTDIVFTAISSASGTAVSGTFLIELIEKDK